MGGGGSAAGTPLIPGDGGRGGSRLPRLTWKTVDGERMGGCWEPPINPSIPGRGKGLGWVSGSPRSPPTVGSDPIAEGKITPRADLSCPEQRPPGSSLPTGSGKILPLFCKLLFQPFPPQKRSRTRLQPQPSPAERSPAHLPAPTRCFRHTSRERGTLLKKKPLLGFKKRPDM